MKPPITIRKAEEKDLPHWLFMRKQLWPSFSFDELKEAEHLLKTKNFVCFFAESGTKVLGFMELSLRPYVNGCDSSPVAFVEGIWVDESQQKQGIGQVLIKEAERWAQAHSVKELASDTRIESTHSIHAHKSWGFEETERVVYFRKKL